MTTKLRQVQLKCLEIFDIVDNLCKKHGIQYSLCVFFESVAEFLGNISSNYTYRELFGAYYYYNMTPYKASIFEKYSTIEFEGRKVMIVQDYLDYLQTRYNRTDFHEPIEKQVPPHLLYVDLNTPYKEYIEKKHR